MNARVVKRILMRNRTTSFWGRRSYVSARVPASLYPEPCPGFEPPGRPTVLSGVWVRREDDRAVVTHVGVVSSGGDPRDREWEPWERPLIVEEVDYGYRWYECWESVHEWRDDADWEELDLGPEVERRPGDPSLAAAYRAREQWIAEYVHGQTEREKPELVERLQRVSWPAKATYAEVGQDHVAITWAVKWFSPFTKRRFCATLSRAVRALKRAGIPVRVF